ncbi:hypothetical protein ABMX48_36335 [Streptomyces cavourensis]
MAGTVPAPLRWLRSVDPGLLSGVAPPSPAPINSSAIQASALLSHLETIKPLLRITELCRFWIWFLTRKMPPSRSVRARGHFSKVAKGDAYLKREDLQKLFTYWGELTDHVQAHFYRMYMAALEEQKEDLTASMP